MAVKNLVFRSLVVSVPFLSCHVDSCDSDNLGRRVTLVCVFDQQDVSGGLFKDCFPVVWR